MDHDSAAEILGEHGPFAKAISNYTVRDSQLAMATAIEDSISNKQTLLAESGTGTGKTFAYLVPALLSARKPWSRLEPSICKNSCFIVTFLWY